MFSFWRPVKTHQKGLSPKKNRDRARSVRNIVRLYAVYEDQRHVYLVMELCEGGELFDRVGDAFTGAMDRGKGETNPSFG